MAKLLGPDFIALMVSDMERSKAFYTGQLGLTPAPQSPPDAVVFQTQPVPLAIRKPALDLSETDKLGWGVALWVAADDAEGLHQSLSDAGVNIVQLPFDGPFGRTFAFLDPDGYRITVHQNR